MSDNDDNHIYKQSEKFIRHLEKTAAELRSWPEWKRNMLGPALPEDRKSYTARTQQTSYK